MSNESMTLAELLTKKGEEIGVSDWMTISQDRINGFADVTEDHQFIHLDVERAKAETPFGGTIAHGFLTLSLMVPMADQALPNISDRKMGINYGMDKLPSYHLCPRVRVYADALPWTTTRSAHQGISCWLSSSS